LARDARIERKLLCLSAGSMAVGWVTVILLFAVDAERLSAWRMLGPLVVLSVAGHWLSWFTQAAFVKELAISAGRERLARVTSICLAVGAAAILVVEASTLLAMYISFSGIDAPRFWECMIVEVCLGYVGYVVYLILIGAMWVALAPRHPIRARYSSGSFLTSVVGTRPPMPLQGFRNQQ
jgi:hypothetical protein